ncbi:MAG: hypothetical protein CMJ80_15375 [Planctomycetaceae bacterium]|nr:hypothetical protein [Planctomycetaceae bacterium]
MLITEPLASETGFPTTVGHAASIQIDAIPVRWSVVDCGNTTGASRRSTVFAPHFAEQFSKVDANCYTWG